MRVLLTLDDGSTHAVERSSDDATPFVLFADARCLTCSALYALVDADGAVRGLGKGPALHDVTAELEREHGPLTWEWPRGGLRATLPRPEEHSHGWRGRAVCYRCRRDVGDMDVQADTLFGLEEDRRVLGGPWRVY